MSDITLHRHITTLTNLVLSINDNVRVLTDLAVCALRRDSSRPAVSAYQEQAEELLEVLADTAKRVTQIEFVLGASSVDAAWQGQRMVYSTTAANAKKLALAFTALVEEQAA